MTLVLLFLSCSSETLSEVQPSMTSTVRPVNHLGVEIHKKLSAEGGNVFFSPISIFSALGMLLYGARGNTSHQMKRALGFENSNLTDNDIYLAYKKLTETFSDESSNASDEYSLYMANAALIQKGHPILSDYVTGLQNIYSATVREVDFVEENTKVTREINEWVNNKTHGQIDRLLSEGDLDNANILVLLNAVFFKGTWKIQFDPKKTYDGVFYNRGSTATATLVPMMHLREDVLYAEYNGVRVLELPYKGEHISMVILLPEEMDGLAQLEENLTPDTFRHMRSLTTKTEILVILPKFKLEFEKNMNQVLKTLGMDIFGANADFSGISGSGPLSVSEAIHKAVVEVNEEGSQASAITFIAIARSYSSSGQITMNHPFLFAIVDRRSNLTLFQGRIEEF